MKLTKIVLGLMVSLPMVSFADFNPATVFSSSTSNSPSSATSAYVQAGALVTPATTPVTKPIPSVPTSSPATPQPHNPAPGMGIIPTAPTANATSTSPTGTVLPNTPGWPITPTNPLTPVVPASGAGGGQSLLSAINQGVQSINSNMSTWRSQDAALMQASGASLDPSNPTALSDFLNNQTGYSGFAQMLNTSNLAPTPLSIDFNLAPQAGANYDLLLNPNAVSLPLGAKSLPLGSSSVASYVAQSSFRNMVSSVNFLDTAGTQSIVHSAFNMLANQNLPTNTNTSASFMSSLAQAVNAPFVTTPDSVSNQTWMQQLSTASSPQALRTIAVQLALQNQMQYQQLQNQQMLIALLSNIAVNTAANGAYLANVNRALAAQGSQLDNLIGVMQQIRNQSKQ